MEHMRYYSFGTPEYPMSQTQMQEKFSDCASQAVSDNMAGKIFAILGKLNEQPSFKEFWPLVRRS
jgi:hypothetical protein